MRLNFESYFHFQKKDGQIFAINCEESKIELRLTDKSLFLKFAMYLLINSA